MAWPIASINSWEHLLELFSVLRRPDPTRIGHIFRGQADASWGLKPSLLRPMAPNVTPTQAIHLEEAALVEFQSQAHLHINPVIADSISGPLDWWALMQHHHAPTRLLDWTLSPFVAAYFAVEQCCAADGAIWFLQEITLVEGVLKRFGPSRLSLKNDQVDTDLRNPDANLLVQPWCPARRSDRMVTQQGRFTFCHNVLGDQEVIIDDLCAAAENGERVQSLWCKLIVPTKLKLKVLNQLRAMNVTAGALFPGIDGLGRSITEMIRIGAGRA
jgi:hypothetical protein